MAESAGLLFLFQSMRGERLEAGLVCRSKKIMSVLARRTVGFIAQPSVAPGLIARIRKIKEKEKEKKKKQQQKAAESFVSF